MELMIEMNYMELIIGMFLGSVITGCVLSILDGLKKIRIIKHTRDDIL
tara:strand:- start:90 stop:233 length:144 start_codon:yes stop_codon:yes gene_type:complete